MVIFPRSTLYRTAGWLVISATLALMMASSAATQVSRGDKPQKSPRALGLIEMTNGKVRLIPITILIDGQYFDAGAYKASPVPMALWGDTVYEGFKTGVSQGLFTVKSALEKTDTHQWMGEGTWLPASAIRTKSVSKETSSIPRGLNEDEGPPVLRHAGATRPKAPEADPAPPAATPAPMPPSPPSPAAAPATPPAAPPPANDTKAAAPAAPPEPDKDAPTLKRGKPAPKPSEPLTVTSVSTAKHGSSSETAAASQALVFPAISAEGGPEPRPYGYSMKPEEEQQFRKQMLAMAADEVRARAKQLAAQAIAAPDPARNSPPRKSAAAKPPQPDFEDVQLRVFDLNSSNEPVLILSAKAHFPQKEKEADGGLQYIITLVARQDVNTDLHKAFSNITDSTHLDVIPRMELIDAVDVDGDGRGELLFRQVSGAGTAFVVYRVIGNQLYALFQGTPAE
jgi:hypothetical protein